MWEKFQAYHDHGKPKRIEFKNFEFFIILHKYTLRYIVEFVFFLFKNICTVYTIVNKKHPRP